MFRDFYNIKINNNLYFLNTRLKGITPYENYFELKIPCDISDKDLETFKNIDNDTLKKELMKVLPPDFYMKLKSSDYVTGEIKEIDQIFYFSYKNETIKRFKINNLDIK